MSVDVSPERADLPTTEAEPRSLAARATVLAVALVAAVLGALVAPDAWPRGPGVFEVVYQGDSAVRAPIAVGAGEAITLAGSAGETTIRVALDHGVPVDRTVRVRIAVAGTDGPVRPALTDVEVRVTLSDGRSELVPILQWDAVKKQLRAERRPPRRAGVVLGLLGLVIVLWITEVFPLFVTALLVPVVLVASGVGEATEALAPFWNPIIALFFGGFLMAEGMRRVALDHRAAITIVARVGRSPVALFAAMLGVSAFLSMWMSNTAATAVLVPIALAVTEPLHHLGYRKAMVLGIAYAATIGGVGSAIGTPANPLAMEFLATFAGRTISFVEWFAFGLPLVLLLLPVMGFYLWRRSDVRVDPNDFRAAREVARDALQRAGPMTRDQLVVLLVFFLVMLTWLTQTWHGLNTGIVAVGGAVLLAILGKVLPEDLGVISWSALLTFGGGLTLGLFLVETGTSDWVATRLAGFASLPPFLGLTAVAVLALGLTTVASNTASAAMLVPLAIPLAGVLGLDPTMLVIVVAIASSIDFALVIGTPPTMIAYSTHLFTVREIFRTGIALDLIGIGILITAVLGVWSLLGLV